MESITRFPFFMQIFGKNLSIFRRCSGDGPFAPVKITYPQLRHSSALDPIKPPTALDRLIGLKATNPALNLHRNHYKGQTRIRILHPIIGVDT
jgi:hypothetical protein